MIVNEIFASIDGEVNRFHQGRLTTFVRMAGCDLKCSYCFGVLGGRRIPKIITSEGSNKKITDIKVGDKLLTFDNDGKLVETKVTESFFRRVDIWYRIKINGRLYFVTPEHPFFTVRGLVSAGDLKVGDVILRSDPKDKISFSKIGSKNPMKRREVVLKSVANTDYKKTGKKISKTIRRKQEEGSYLSSWELLDDEGRDNLRGKISESKKGDKNPNWKGGSLTPNYDDLKQRIKNKEIKICSVCKKEKNLDVHHKDGDRNNDKKNNLNVLCESCHYSGHKIGYNFWNSKRVDGRELAVKNGFLVQGIKLFDRSNFSPSIRPEKLKVYNFKCFPYNTYLVDYMWVHNCDTEYAQREDQGYPMSIEQVRDEIYKIGLNKITFTGGEPLLQSEELERLILLMKIESFKNNIEMITIETNGSFPVIESVRSFVSWVMDWKLWSSGMNGKMDINNFINLDVSDWVKFVIMNRKDYEDAKDVMKEIIDYNNVNFAMSPVFGKVEAKQLMDWMIADKLDAILNIQVHKIIGLK